MENKKVLKITCGVCDARKVQESTLAAYERIEIVCDILLAGPEAKKLLANYAVSVTADQVLDLEGEVRISSVNGAAEIHPGQVLPDGKWFLTVNGNLDIAPGSEDVLKSYLGISVNGSVTCPQSLAALLSAVSVNGCIDTYPDGCVRLKNTSVLDRTFRLRARQDAHYYANRRIVALAPDIDFEKLAAKNVRFTTPRLLVAESLAEAAVSLFSEQTDITVLPDGCAYVKGDAVLDEALFRRYGEKLYIQGRLTVNRNSEPYLSQISFLHVNGDVCVAKPLVDAFQEMRAVYGRMCIVGGKLLSDRPQVQVTPELLEEAVDGLSMANCAYVMFHEDVSPELIRERVTSIRYCAYVICSQAQRAVLETLTEDAGYLGAMPQGGEQAEETAGDPWINSVTADKYVL